MSGLIWIQSVWHSDMFLKEFFEKVDFEKNQQTTKSMQNYQAGKGFNPDIFCFEIGLDQDQLASEKSG